MGEVERRRTLRILDDSTNRVVVISAPAGSGKSILARQWISRGTRAHAVLRLGRYMDDPALLSLQIIEVLESFGPQAPEARACATNLEPAFSTILLPALSRVVQTRSEPFVLVVEDVHLLESSDAHHVLQAVCEAIPHDSTIVLLTRTMTPDWMARIRSTGELLEISAYQMDFDFDEANLLLECMGVHLDKSEVAAIVEHTEGWAVGVYLTALSLRDDAAKGSNKVRIAKGSDRFVADYLRTQVLRSLSEDQQRFLVRTSVLEELNGSLCDAVLERSDSAEVLAEIHTRVQLVIAIGPDREQFRCHQLLSEELLADLHVLEPASIAGLHERACHWFDSNGDIDSAIRHATASGNTNLASRMIWPQVAGCLASGRLGILHSWLGGLSERQISEDRWLCLAAAWASLQQGDGTAMGRWARHAERHAGTAWREIASSDSYAATLGVLHALVGQGGLDDTRDLCKRALSGLPPDDCFRASAAQQLGVALSLQRDLEGGRASLIEAELLGRSLGVPVVQANAKSWLGLLAIADGQHDDGMRVIAEASEVIRRHHLDRLATGALCLAAQAYVQALQGEKAAASMTFATARRLAEVAGEIAPWFAVSGRIIQARTAILLGDSPTARVLISEARRRMTVELRATTVAESLEQVESALAQMADLGGPAGALTPAELRIVQFLPSHLTLQQIGDRLFVSQSTVKTHVLSIYRKFGVGSRAEAVVQARALGLVEGPLSD